eukprot:g31264.t1
MSVRTVCVQFGVSFSQTIFKILKPLIHQRSSQQSKNIVLIFQNKLDLKKCKMRMLNSCLKTSLQLIYNNPAAGGAVEAGDEEDRVQDAAPRKLFTSVLSSILREIEKQLQLLE